MNKSLKEFKSFHEQVFKAYRFKQETLNVSFIEKCFKYYPLAQIDESMFDIEITYLKIEWALEKSRVCKIHFKSSFFNEIGKYYPEVLI